MITDEGPCEHEDSWEDEPSPGRILERHLEPDFVHTFPCVRCNKATPYSALCLTCEIKAAKKARGIDFETGKRTHHE